MSYSEWISKYAFVFAGAFLIIGLWPTESLAGGCSWWQFWGCEDTPTSEEIIEAVRQSVLGKTYTKDHHCVKADVVANPGRCPSVGHTARETRHCASLPAPQFGWHVQGAGEDRWWVTYSGSAWDVEKADGAATQAGELIRISRFAFKIHPHQDC